MDHIIFNGENAVQTSDIASGDKIILTEDINGDKLACKMKQVYDGDEVIIVKLKNGDKIAVKSSNCIKITSQFGRAVVAQYEVIDLGDFIFYWNGTSNVYIGAVCRDITSENTSVDDQLTITSKTSGKSISYTWGRYGGGVIYTAALEITSVMEEGSNTLNIQIIDQYGVSIGSTNLYLFAV